MNTSCPRDVLTIPRMALRVVCGTGETMDTGSPHAVLRNVDFPEDGRPTIVTTAVFVPPEPMSGLLSLCSSFIWRV